jgi:hypothetical protein
MAPPLRIVKQCQALEPCWASQPGRAGGLAIAATILPAFFLKKIYQHCERLIYTSCRTCIFIFQTNFETGCFSLMFPWTGWFRNFRFWDGLQFFLPFNSRFLDVDGQKLCEKSALYAVVHNISQQLRWSWVGHGIKGALLRNLRTSHPSRLQCQVDQCLSRKLT